MSIVGMSLGALGFIFGMSALNKVRELEQKLKDKGVLAAGEDKQDP